MTNNFRFLLQARMMPRSTMQKTITQKVTVPLVDNLHSERSLNRTLTQAERSLIKITDHLNRLRIDIVSNSHLLRIISYHLISTQDQTINSGIPSNYLPRILDRIIRKQIFLHSNKTHRPEVMGRLSTVVHQNPIKRLNLMTNLDSMTFQDQLI